ncbi:alkaline phosphatase PhoX [Pseudonocardia zijingensis]|jgi:secreted PhoX family phosphatase|uniref:PhoX family protein n=1 Tax=Pseudonocardia zijingensis TaxID=153376 RepID=A0ABP3YP26_9PSEU
MGLTRRSFIRRAGAGVLLAGSTSMLRVAAPPAGYGPLVDDPKGLLALPEGFTYEIVSEAGVTSLETGEPTPRNHDGTGAFPGPGGGTVLVLNHEIREGAGTDLAVPHLDGLVYDPGAAGGCTVVTADAAGRRVGDRVAIAGTSTNCAGGVTPWHTWLTCEETEARAGERGYERDHGYVFEVDPFDRAALVDPRPVKALGRYSHEALAVDPGTGQIYLTEDASGPNGLVYRWTPPAGLRVGRGVLRGLGDTDGVLAAMRCTDEGGGHVDDLSRAGAPGTTYAVEWVEVPDRDAREESVRKQFDDGRVTRAHKLEGAWWGHGGAYIVSSYSGGGSPGSHRGQVWFYDPQRSTFTLRLRFTGEDDGADGPDNISVSPYGGVIVAEDGGGTNHLVAAAEDGTTFQVARSERGGEFTGPVFSADGRVLFANLQVPGTMFAITGPWG